MLSKLAISILWPRVRFIGLLGLVAGLATLAGIGFVLFLERQPGRLSSMETADTVIRADGSRRLTAGIGSVSYQNACFSPDGSQLVYTRWRDGYNRGPADLIIYDLETKTERLLVGDDESANVNAPYRCWSNDTIVFASDRAGAIYDELWSIRSNGSDLKQITNHKELGPYLEPVFSPDGQHMAFEVDRASDEDDEQLGLIYTARSDGSEMAQITSQPKGRMIDDRLPSWSGGNRLLFQRRELQGDGWGHWDVYLVEPKLKGRWTEPKSVIGQVAVASDETDNAWSPDERYIISSSDYQGLAHPNIFAFPLTGGVPKRLTFSPDREDGAASLSPNDSLLVFESHRETSEESSSDIWLKSVQISLESSPAN